MKEPTTNILVPRLLDKTNIYTNNIKNRIKIDNIFNEFDDNANINFKKFIKLSEKRYKSVKSGTSLNNILENQKPEYNELSSQILTNKFYNNDEIEMESKKLLKKMGAKENQDLILLRKDIIAKTKDFTKSEIRNREKMIHNALKKRKNKEKFSRKDYSYNPKLLKYRSVNVSPSKGDKMPKIKIKNHEKKTNKDELLEKKKYFDDLMKNDCKKLNDNLLDYKLYLKDVEKTHKDGDPLKLNNNKDNFGHTYNFSQDRIKLLTYKEEEIQDKKPKKKEEPKVDIIKLMRYTKRGNKKWFKNELKNKSNKKFLPFKRNLTKIRPIFNSENPISKINTANNFYPNNKELKDEISNNIPSNTHTNMNTNLNTFTEDFNFNKTSSTNFTNYKNTIKTVRNEATKVKFMNENFDRKLHTMEGFFKINHLPKIEDYENIIKHKGNYADNIDSKNNSKDFNLPKEKKDSWNDYERNKYDSQKQIFLAYNKTYQNKKIIWEKEDKRRDYLKKKNEEKVEEIKKYLKEIKNIGRKPNLYIDPYSKRDKNINNLIKIFNRTLTGGFYSKKRMEYKLNEFNNKFERREKEKKMHEEFMNQKLFEEEKKRKEEDIEYQIFSKMKENLRKENNDENKNEDIDFNYKMVLSRGLVTNKIKIDPYKEYKEFYALEKEKQEKENKKKINFDIIDPSLLPNNNP